MSNYSYSEIQDMQRKAMERVREMKRNSDIVTSSAQKEFDRETLIPPVQKVIEPKITNMPPNFPKNNPYPSFKTVFENENKVTVKEQKPPQRPAQEKRDNIIETFFAEPDKALLLGLIMLLKSERADEALILALTYILS
ncbi:MAG: hypothetical protein IKV25_07515 [Clostridia bacterium]|nr:hypothetical protein [Clostridia bacterium]